LLPEVLPFLSNALAGILLFAGSSLQQVGLIFTTVVTIGWLAPKLEVIKLAVLQFWVCSVLSLGVGLLVEQTVWSDLAAAPGPILSHAAIILSLDTVFAVLSGCLILGETLRPRVWLGCALMLCGMLAAPKDAEEQD
jgi:uncharacterized membrane protein